MQQGAPPASQLPATSPTGTSTVKIFAAALLVLVVMLVGIGFVLPSDYEVTRSIVIAAPPQEVHKQVEDLHAWSEWMVWLEEDPDMEISYSGADKGADARMDWTGKDGVGQLTVMSSDPAKGVWFECLFDETYVLHGAVCYEAEGDGTRVTFTGRGDLGGNPLYHYLGLMMDSAMGPDYEANLQNIKTIVESE